MPPEGFLHAYLFIAFRPASGKKHPNASLASDFRRFTKATKRLVQKWLHSWIGSALNRPPRNVLFQCLAKELSYIYYTSIKRQERKYFRQLIFCNLFYGIYYVSRHAYQPINLLSNPCRPLWEMDYKCSYFFDIKQFFFIRTSLNYSELLIFKELILKIVQTSICNQNVFPFAINPKTLVSALVQLKILIPKMKAALIRYPAFRFIHW